MNKQNTLCKRLVEFSAEKGAGHASEQCSKDFERILYALLSKDRHEVI